MIKFREFLIGTLVCFFHHKMMKNHKLPWNDICSTINDDLRGRHKRTLSSPVLHTRCKVTLVTLPSITISCFCSHHGHSCTLGFSLFGYLKYKAYMLNPPSAFDRKNTIKCEFLHTLYFVIYCYSESLALNVSLSRKADIWKFYNLTKMFCLLLLIWINFLFTLGIRNEHCLWNIALPNDHCLYFKSLLLALKVRNKKWTLPCQMMIVFVLRRYF